MTGLTPELIAVSVPRHGTLALRFADGTAGEVDVLDRLRGPIFEPVRTEDGFAAATLDEELGTVVWPNGADLAPDVLYEQVRALAVRA